jgi:Ni/Co efflux regulator RcnB
MRILIAVLLVAALGASPALAQDKKAADKKEPTAEQKRQADCTQQAAAKSLQGRERTQFVSTCMRGGEQPTAKK